MNHQQCVRWNRGINWDWLGMMMMIVGGDDDDDGYDDDDGGGDEEEYKKTLSMTSLIFNYFQAHHKIITTDLVLQSVIEPIQGKTKN